MEKLLEMFIGADLSACEGCNLRCNSDHCCRSCSLRCTGRAVCPLFNHTVAGVQKQKRNTLRKRIAEQNEQLFKSPNGDDVYQIGDIAKVTDDIWIRNGITV